MLAELVDVDAVPLKVVAVIVLPSADIPVSTYKAVPAKPPFERVPIKYSVELVSVVVADKTEDEAIAAIPDKEPLNVVAFIVFPKALTPDKI